MRPDGGDRARGDGDGVAVVAASRRFVAARPGTSVAVAAFLLMAVWGLLAPLFAGPDENSNYVHAAAIVRGELVGEGRDPTLFESYYRTEVDIDRQFGAANWVPWCFAPMPSEPACDRPIEDTDPRDPRPFTMQGRYPPGALIAPGLGTVVGPNDLSARLGRLLDAAVVAGLLGLAASRLARSGHTMTALLVVFTPGLQFLGGVINPSGVEIAAAVGVWLYLPVALDRRRGPWSRRDDVALAVCAVALVLARQLGAAVLAVIAVACVVAAVDHNPLPALWERARVTLGAAAAATVAMLVWYAAVFSEHLGTSVADGEPSIGRAAVVERSIGHLPEVVAQHVGNFGWLDTRSPTIVVWYFLVLTVAVLVMSWARMTVRERVAVAGLVVVIAVLNVYLDLGFYRLLRIIGVQGRHLSPLLVGVPLLVVHRWRPSDAARRWIGWSWTAAVFLAGLFALRRYAVGVVPDNFFDVVTDPVWTPVLGIVPTLVALLAAAGAVAWVCTTAGDAAPAAPGRRSEAPADDRPGVAPADQGVS